MSLTFRRRHRITHARDFRAVFEAKLQKPAGPLVVHARPSLHPEPRLGLSIGRRVGPAHDRTALKRRIRDAFRHIRADLPHPPNAASYDLVVSARPHTLLKSHEYAELLAKAIESIHRTVARRADHV